MEYLVTFTEGLASFISPCSLPLVPIYIAYFSKGSNKKSVVFLRALCFCLGFTLMFSILGIFASSIGMALQEHRKTVNIISGVIVIFFGISYIFDLHFKMFRQKSSNITPTDSFKAFLFGIVFSINASPCVGVFLGSALMAAGNTESLMKGLSLLFIYSLGLAVPFLLSSLFINALTPLYTFIKKHYKIINVIAGCVLIISGVLIALGIFSPISSKRSLSKQNNSQRLSVENNKTAIQKSNKSSNGSLLIRKDLFTVKDRNEKDVSLESKFGKPIFINFWASWCGPCKSEFSEIEKAYKNYGDKIEFMIINLTYSDLGDIRETIDFINNLGYTFPLYFDVDGDASGRFNITGIPHSVFYDASGKLIKQHTGAMTYKMIENYLNEIQ